MYYKSSVNLCSGTKSPPLLVFPCQTTFPFSLETNLHTKTLVFYILSQVALLLSSAFSRDIFSIISTTSNAPVSTAHL